MLFPQGLSLRIISKDGKLALSLQTTKDLQL
jgi:hypothetical protein